MAAADALRRFMEEDHITAFDPKWEKGLLRHLIVKTAFGTGEVMVILVINGKGIPNAPKLIDMLDEAIYEVGYSLESVIVNVNKASGKNVEKNKKKDRSEIRVSGEILGDEYITIAGKPVITETLGHLQFEISAASFFQVNPVQMKRLYDQVRAYVMMSASGASTGEGGDLPVILDLYCGIGSIGLYSADLAEMVIGIESVKEAVTDANRNAVINGIVSARYICGKAEEVLPMYVRGGEGCDPELSGFIRRAGIAILDPPRAGCRPELLEAVAEAGVHSIIYVSCDPATLARDVQLLQELGYGFVEATPVDMFPHTTHVETVCLLSHQSRKFAEIKIDTEDLTDDNSFASPTYKNIKAWILETYGVKMHTAYIAQVKRKYGLPMRECAHKSKNEEYVPQVVSEEQEKMIVAALKHFNAIK